MLGVACCSCCCNVRLLSAWKGVAIRAIRRHLMARCRDFSCRSGGASHLAFSATICSRVDVDAAIGQSIYLFTQPENRSV